MPTYDEVKKNINNYESIMDAIMDIDIDARKKPTIASPVASPFAALSIALTDLYAKKNADYGDSFGKSVSKYGNIAALTRISDKFNRLESLMIRNTSPCIGDERVIDTLADLASYAIMTIIAISTPEEIEELCLKYSR